MTQLIFCDYATPKKDAFNVYDALKEKLIQCGILAVQIAFIHHYHTESCKLELFRKFNAGDIRILIGSTFKLDIGANVQERLKPKFSQNYPTLLKKFQNQADFA